MKRAGTRNVVFFYLALLVLNILRFARRNLLEEVSSISSYHQEFRIFQIIFPLLIISMDKRLSR